MTSTIRNRPLPQALLLGAALALALAGCSKPPSTGVVPVSQKSLGSALPVDHPPLGTPGATSDSRQPTRLTILQLRGSLPVALGNDVNGNPITWQVGSAQKPAAGLDAFSRTLGEADYVNATEDNLEPSPIYVKFMDDAARNVCDQALAADAAQPTPSQRTILRYVSPQDTPETNLAGFNQNLSYLKLRWHGIKVTDDAPLAPLRVLFTAAGQNSRTPGQDGWRAVCVTLLTAPEFHIY
jgi:hypothetical protein